MWHHTFFEDEYNARIARKRDSFLFLNFFQLLHRDAGGQKILFPKILGVEVEFLYPPEKFVLHTCRLSVEPTMRSQKTLVHLSSSFTALRYQCLANTEKSKKSGQFLPFRGMKTTPNMTPCIITKQFHMV